MSKRVIFAKDIDDGKFIQVESKKPAFNCPEYPALEEEIREVQAMLPPSGTSFKKPMTPASVFDCPSYEKLMRKLIRLKLKLWKYKLAQWKKGGSNYTPGSKLPPDLANLYANILRAIAKFSKDTSIPIDRKPRF